MRSSTIIAFAIACAFSLDAAAQTSRPVAPPAGTPPAASPGPAAAPAAAEPTAEQREAARAAYANGQALFSQGRYAEAKAAFEQAYAALPNPVVLISVAECEARLGNLEAAYATYQRYLEGRPDAPDRADVEQKIAELLATPATLSLASTPSGAAISVDGQPTGKQTPAELPLPRGDHRIEVNLAGHEPTQVSVTARLGARHELEVVLKALPPPPPVPDPPANADVGEDDGSPEAALWITGIVGAAGIVTGSVLGFLVLAEQSDFDSNPTAESADHGERLALFTDVAFGVGAMALITGAVLLFTADSTDQPEQEAAQARRSGVELIPAASPHGAALVARGSF